MEKFVEQSLLYDFYGDLLTDHQKDIYSGYVLENLSLAEIAESSGISRQGVHDIIRRSTQALEEYEEKLHLVSRFLQIKDKVAGIEHCTDLEEAKRAARDILELL